MCALVVTITEPVAIPLLRRAAVIDMPGHRSSHIFPTPRGGGVAITAGLMAAAIAVGGVTAIAFGATIAAFGLIGLAEDLVGVPPASRLVLQLTAGMLAGLVLVSRSAAAGFVLAAAAVAAGLWITGSVNAFNFMDGVNGISGAHALLGGVIYAVAGWWRGDPFLLAAGAALAAGGLAFLPWNAGRARVFLGDVGSYALGAAVGFLGIYAVIAAHVPPEAALGPVALYLTDTGWTLCQRAWRHERLLEAHRMHVYQRWTDAGWSHQRVTAVTTGISALLSVAGLMSLAGLAPLRIAADLAGCAVLAGYASSPGPLLRRAARASAVSAGPAPAAQYPAGG